MKKLFAALVFFASQVALAGSPVIWEGTLSNFLPPGGFDFQGNVQVLIGTTDPSVTGANAKQGSLYIEYGSSNGFFQKLDNGNTTNWGALATAGAYQLTSQKGQFNGYAGLDGGGRVPFSQLPASLGSAFVLRGNWNANTNTPTLTSGTGSLGDYYVVSVSGTTNLDGITNWNAGDAAYFDGTHWQHIASVQSVISVNGLQGTVVLTTSNITEGSNLYYTDARAQAAITGSAPISVSSGVVSIANIVNANISTSAAIARSKIASGTANAAVINDGSGNLSQVVPGGSGCLQYNSGTTTWSVASCGAGSVTSVALSAPAEFTVSGSPVTSTGTLALAWASAGANKVLATPDGSSGAPSARSLVGGDLPNPGASSLGGVESLTCSSHQFFTQIGTNGAPACSALATGDMPSISLTGDTTGSGSAGSIATTLASSISGAKTFSTSLTSPAFISSSSNPASAGLFRLASGDLIEWRNNANSANIALGKDTSDNLSFGGTSFLSSSGVLLAAGFPILTGDVTTPGNSLATTIANSAVTNAKMANMSGHTYKGNNTGSSAAPSDVSAANVIADISPQTTKGDLISYSTVPARQAVPSDYGDLVPDSGQTTGWRSETIAQASNRNGRKNYVQYGDFENNATTGWSATGCATVTNGLCASVGSGGAAFSSSNGGRTKNGNTNGINIDATSQLSGTYSMKLSTSGASSAGDGYISQAIPIDASEQGRMLQWSMRYRYISGTPTLNGTSSNSYGVQIYDVTNNAWIGGSGNFNIVQQTGPGMASGTFQVPINTTQVQVFIFFPTAPAGTIAMDFDDIYVGPQISNNGPAVTDWVAWTPTGTWNTNTTYAGFYRRVGDSADFYVRVTTSGAPNSTSLQVNTPSGITMDTTKLNTTEESTLLGRAKIRKHNTASYNLTQVTFASTTSVGVNGVGLSTFSGTQFMPDTYSTNQATPITYAASDYVEIWWTAPIVGWSSNTAMSSDTDTRAVAMTATSNSTQTVTSSDSQVTGWTAVNDSHGAFASNQYTIPVTGWYQVNAEVLFGTIATQRLQISLYKNGSLLHVGQQVLSSSSFNISSTLNQIFYFNSGDVLKVEGNSTSSVALACSSTQCNWSVQRVSGPAVITATETVAVSYGNSSATTTINTTDTELSFDSKTLDTHGAWTGNNTLTIPSSGVYRVTCDPMYNVTAFTGATNIDTKIYVNGAQVGYHRSQSIASTQFTNNAETYVNRFAPGTTINCYASKTGTGITVNEHNDAGSSRFFAERVGP